MKVLVDACVPRSIGNLLLEQSDTVQQLEFVTNIGWEELDDPELFQRSHEDYDLLLSCDTNLPNHVNLSKFELSVIVIHALKNTPGHLKPLISNVVKSLQKIEKYEFVKITKNSVDRTSL